MQYIKCVLFSSQIFFTLLYYKQQFIAKKQARLLDNCNAMSLKASKASKVAKSDQHYLQTALPSNCKILQLDNCFRVRSEEGEKVPVLYKVSL